MKADIFFDKAIKTIECLDVDSLKNAGFLPIDQEHLHIPVYPPYTGYMKTEGSDRLDDLEGRGSQFALYIHIPFCRQICSFCQFSVLPVLNEKQIDKYIDYTIRELDLWQAKLKPGSCNPSSAFIGGGTPSLLSPGQITRLGKEISARFTQSHTIQFSIDTEPSDLCGSEGMERLMAMKEIGLNRICIGAQSFDNTVLKAMNRPHGTDHIVESISQARSAGFESIAVDLIYGFPGLDLEKWLETLNHCLSLNVDSIQIYQLRIRDYKPGNSFTKHVRKAFKNNVSPEYDPYEALLLKVAASHVLLDGGYYYTGRGVFTKGEEHISEYLKDWYCRGRDLIGIGISSGSMFRNVHTLNCSGDLEKYYSLIDRDSLPVEGIFRLSQDDRERRDLIMPLKNSGKILWEDYLKQYNVSAKERFRSRFEILKYYELLEEDEKGVWLTEKGSLFDDAVLIQFHQKDLIPFGKDQYLPGRLNPYGITESKGSTVLLIQPYASKAEPDPFLRPSCMEPLTLLYLGNELKKAGFNVVILSGTASENEVVEAVTKFRPLVIGFSVYTYMLKHCQKLADAARKTALDHEIQMSVVFGGYHPSAVPEKVAELKQVDFVVFGEGEIPFCDLALRLSQGQDVQNVKGICYNTDQGVRRNPLCERLLDIDHIKPLRERKHMEANRQNQLSYPPPSGQICSARISASRGCPFSCSFCSSVNVWGNRVVYYSPKVVADEIEKLYRNYGTNLVSFTDLTFNSDRKRVINLCKEIENRDLPVYWWGLMRPDLFDKELLDAMVRAKCVKLCIGIESLSHDTAKAVKDSYERRFELIAESLEYADSLGILVKAFLMIGFPEETRETILEYSPILKKLCIDELRITFATPLPGTRLWETCMKKGLIEREPDLTKFSTEEPVIRHPHLSNNELYELRRSLIVDFFLSESFRNRMKTKISLFPHLKESFLEYFQFYGNRTTFIDDADLKILFKDIASCP